MSYHRFSWWFKCERWNPKISINVRMVWQDPENPGWETSQCNSLHNNLEAPPCPGLPVPSVWMTSLQTWQIAPRVTSATDSPVQETRGTEGYDRRKLPVRKSALRVGKWGNGYGVWNSLARWHRKQGKWRQEDEYLGQGIPCYSD